MSLIIHVELTIINKLGLHARAAAKLASTAGKYGCTIKTGPNESKLVDAKSVMSLMLLAASQGTVLHFQFEGNDAEKAHRDIQQLLIDKFDEEQ
jgi:phosphocarrier protein NPr